MSDDWASSFRPGFVPEIPQDANSDVPQDTMQGTETTEIDTKKILLGFEAIVRRLDAMDKRMSLFEQILAEPVWLPGHIDNLRKLHHLNAEAMLQANQQFAGLVIRKLDEMEERIKSDEPSYTNVLYSDPELFNEISSREDEEKEEEQEVEQIPVEEDMTPVIESNGSAPDIPAEMIMEVPEEVQREYESWKDPEKDGSWQSFVKVCGGPVKAKRLREMIES
tara:strand:+ start:2626 stop:3291 length:666 start_codon:yes stop_codon:yes gene_type:complete